MDKAYMLISCEIGEEQTLLSKLKEIPEVKNCLITFGSYDIVAEFEDHDAMFMEELDKYVLDIPLTQNVIIMYCAAIWHVQNKSM